MGDQHKPVFVFGKERPADLSRVPEDWAIYNAHRELMGTKTWQGPFRNGIFYAAIDPQDPKAEDWLRGTLRNAGRRVVFVLHETVEAWLEGYCERNGFTVADYLDAYDWVHIYQVYEAEMSEGT